jgi:chemotaxis protein MotA
MDILTLVGLFAGILVVLLAMISDASIGTFVNAPGLAIVVGGTFAVTLIKFRMASVFSSFKLAMKATFTDHLARPVEFL